MPRVADVFRNLSQSDFAQNSRQPPIEAAASLAVVEPARFVLIQPRKPPATTSATATATTTTTVTAPTGSTLATPSNDLFKYAPYIPIVEEHIETLTNQASPISHSEELRLLSLINACRAEDGFFVALNQLLSLWLVDGTKPCSRLLSLTPQMIDDSFGILQQILENHGKIRPSLHKWFSQFPCTIGIDYDEVIVQVCAFLKELVLYWGKVTTRGYPLLMDMILSQPLCVSPILQKFLSEATRKTQKLRHGHNSAAVDQRFMSDKKPYQLAPGTFISLEQQVQQPPQKSPRKSPQQPGMTDRNSAAAGSPRLTTSYLPIRVSKIAPVRRASEFVSLGGNETQPMPTNHGRTARLQHTQQQPQRPRLQTQQPHQQQPQQFPQPQHISQQKSPVEIRRQTSYGMGQAMHTTSETLPDSAQMARQSPTSPQILQGQSTQMAQAPQVPSTVQTHNYPPQPELTPGNRDTPILRPMPADGVMPQQGMQSPYAQSPLMPQSMLPDNGPVLGIGIGAGEGSGAGVQPPSLPEDEDIDHWDDIEDNWLQQVAAARAKEDREMVQEYDEVEALLHAELDDAVCEHNRLTETLLQARVLVDEKKADIEWLVDEFQRLRKAVEDRRAADDFRVRAWITAGRCFIEAHQRHTMNDADDMQLNGHGSPANGNGDNGSFPFPTPGGHPAKARSLPLRNGSNGEHAHDQPCPSPREVAHPSTTPNGQHVAAEYQPNADGSVSVVNTSGDRVGTVMRIRPENHRVQALLERPVQRAVEIRLGCKFTQTHLDSIYEGNDQMRSKWLSFMIQATGELQDRACQTCAKGQGLFSLCIIVGGTDPPRCGNCEWNKQGCHGASGEIANRVPAPTATQQPRQKKQPPQQQQEQQQSHMNGAVGTPTKQAVSAASAFSNQGSPMALDKPDTRPSSSSKRGRTSQGHSQSPDTPQQFDSFMMRDLAPSGDASEEITANTIALRDDGMIFLEPDLMHGVPLRKITPDHAYWEPDWKPFEGTIQSKLEGWTDKLAKLKALPESSLTDKERTAVFQAGRQVNRGKATTRYLATCNFHPYQLVSKKWITPSLTHYDTLFRMVATLDELAKFRLDVTPLQWLRQRIYEIYLENKGNFKLDRAIAKLYHDPKLVHLRSKNGFGNIGRPSAASTPRASDVGIKAGSTDGSPDKKPAGEKRKVPPLGDANASTPTKRALVDSEKRSGKIAAHGRQSRSNRHARSAPPNRAHQQPTRACKPPSSKPRDGKAPASTTGSVSTSATPSRAASHATDDVSASAEDEDLEYSGYTTTDSFTRDTVVKKDWRVYQVKTKNLATNPQTTQYWHWVDWKQAYRSGPGGRRDFDPMFEHQVLKETEPTTGWGVFAEPVDFHLRLRELTEVSFAPDSDIIVIGTREVKGIDRRGNVLAQFKRERTKRRFLAFLKKKGVPLRRTDRHEIDTEWNGIQAEVMAGNESD